MARDCLNHLTSLGVLEFMRAPPSSILHYRRERCREVKSLLTDPSLPYGVDLLLPKVGGAARKTNYDYTHGAATSTSFWSFSHTLFSSTPHLTRRAMYPTRCSC